MSNLPTVQHIYEAFGRGDIPAILAHMAEDVDWEYDKPDAKVPWLERRAGRAGVGAFFESLGALEFQRFEPKALLESGPLVVALIDIALVVRATGRTVAETDEVHLWHFDDAGRVARFSHKVDTHRHWLASQGA